MDNNAMTVPPKLTPIEFVKVMGDMVPDADHSMVTNKILDVPYAHASLAQKMDVFMPDSGEGPFPCIVVIHGGGFCYCDKRNMEVQPFLPGIGLGYVVVSINYRLAHEAPFPAAVIDCKAAIRYLKAHAEEFGIDPDRIAVAGGSAGANLAAMLCTSAGVAAFEDESLGNPDVSSAVQAGVIMFSVTDFLKMDEQLVQNGFPPFGNDKAESPMNIYLGGVMSDLDPQLVQSANPVTYVSEDVPPMLLEHGTADAISPYQQTLLLADRVREVAGDDRVEVVLFDGAEHAGLEFVAEENVKRIFDFLGERL